MSQRIFTTIGAIAAALVLVVLAGVVAVLYTRPASVAQAQTGVTGMRQVTVVGHGEVAGAPDTATVTIGVETEGATAQEALAANNTQAEAVIAKLKDLGVAEKDIQTTNFNIFPVYNEDGRQVRGYHVSNGVTVKIRNLEEAGTLLDQVVQVGANQVYGISFSVDEPKALLDQARERAIQEAKSRADILAKAAGASVGEVLVITENVGFQGPIPIAMPAAEAAQADSRVPVQAGEQNFSVDVQVTYELR